MPLSRERLKTYAKLKQKKYRSLHKQCIIEGVRGIRDVLAADDSGVMIDAVLYTPAFLSDPMHERLLVAVREKGGKVYEVSAADIGRIGDTAENPGVLAVANQWSASTDELLNRGASGLAVAVDAVREPGNLGSLLRTCDWFGVDMVLLGTGTVEVWNPKVLRAAVGSMVHVPFAENVDLAQALPILNTRGYRILGTSGRGGTPVAEAAPAPPAAIVFGNEADGISGGVLGVVDEMITIPRYGRAESLNVGVSAGVILSAIRFNKQKE
jgi:RNA methyltransferase, TrmH family